MTKKKLGPYPFDTDETKDLAGSAEGKQEAIKIRQAQMAEAQASDGTLVVEDMETNHNAEVTG
jgi:hypothetical protein